MNYQLIEVLINLNLVQENQEFFESTSTEGKEKNLPEGCVLILLLFIFLFPNFFFFIEGKLFHCQSRDDFSLIGFPEARSHWDYCSKITLPFE